MKVSKYLLHSAGLLYKVNDELWNFMLPNHNIMTVNMVTKISNTNNYEFKYFLL